MSRTLGKISRDGRQVTDFVPVRCKTELGMSTGHATIPSDVSRDLQPGYYKLHFKDDQEMSIAFTGVCGPKAYFHSVGPD